MSAQSLERMIYVGAMGVVIFALGAFNLYETWRHQDQGTTTVTADEREFARVAKVIDGDTFVTEQGKKVRLIGIDTPETGELYYAEATQLLAKLIEDKEVILRKDVSETDQYGRLLRHVYIGEVWVNEFMIRKGVAHLVTFPPDVEHVAHFKEIERVAREERVGLWSREE